MSTVLTATGYCVVVLTVLSLIAVPLQQLVVGGAVTGVILGIAAQQTLGNVFAGMMILLVRPFRIGDTIEVRSGALNGPFTGRVRALGLTYVTLAAENGTLLLPNAGVLAAGVTVGLEPE
ncbi:small-conductance mechanosensitive channel [Kutzneria viridogrisea]|uniref:Small-conductance mechanosensitive channel n=1 Tax=Kutzneria viridogrisea TaxID=47990 RepID=A0ABR6BC32_9PSEU|nr:small-conductance mechanosensitive channel [Kutzneria viridogrisea]